MFAQRGDGLGVGARDDVAVLVYLDARCIGMLHGNAVVSLPVDRQMSNLLVWAATQLGDDQLGTVELPDEDDLTAVIGTVDGPRVHQLISRTENDGFIELVPDDCVAITAKGWARLQPPPEEEAVASPPTPDATPKVDRIIKAHCNTCRGTTNSWVRAEHTVHGSDGPISWSRGYEVLQMLRLRHAVRSA